MQHQQGAAWPPAQAMSGQPQWQPQYAQQDTYAAPLQQGTGAWAAPAQEYAPQWQGQYTQAPVQPVQCTPQTAPYPPSAFASQPQAQQAPASVLQQAQAPAAHYGTTAPQWPPEPNTLPPLPPLGAYAGGVPQGYAQAPAHSYYPPYTQNTQPYPSAPQPAYACHHQPSHNTAVPYSTMLQQQPYPPQVTQHQYQTMPQAAAAQTAQPAPAQVQRIPPYPYPGVHEEVQYGAYQSAPTYAQPPMPYNAHPQTHVQQYHTMQQAPQHTQPSQGSHPSYTHAPPPHQQQPQHQYAAHAAMYPYPTMPPPHPSTHPHALPHHASGPLSGAAGSAPQAAAPAPCDGSAVHGPPAAKPIVIDLTDVKDEPSTQPEAGTGPVGVGGADKGTVAAAAAAPGAAPHASGGTAGAAAGTEAAVAVAAAAAAGTEAGGTDVKVTHISCSHCAKVGKTYTKVFYGRRISPATGEEETLDDSHLPNDIRGLTEAQLLANGRAVKQFKDHYRNHKDVPYKPSYTGYTTWGPVRARDRLIISHGTAAPAAHRVAASASHNMGSNSKTTLVECVECVKAGRVPPFSKPFYGRRIDLSTGKEVPMDSYNLPNDRGSMSDTEALFNYKKLDSMRYHMRTAHPGLEYRPSHKIPYLANKLPAINPSVPGQDSTQAHFTLQAHPATAHEETKPRAQVAQVAVSDKAIAVSCPECAKSGRAYSRLFYGPHVDPLTGKQLPLDYLHLPNDLLTLSNEELAANGKSIDAIKTHFRKWHPDIQYLPTYKSGKVRQLVRPNYDDLPSDMTLISCPECTKAGVEPYSKPVRGRHVDPLTGRELPLDYLHFPNADVDQMTEEDCHINGQALKGFQNHFYRYHPLIKYKPLWAGYNQHGRKTTRPMFKLRLPSDQAQTCGADLPQTGGARKQAASEPDVSCLGAGAYLSEALVQAEDQLRGLDLHPVHPPVGSGMRTHKAQLLSELLCGLGLRDGSSDLEPRSLWVVDTDQWELSCMDDDTLRSVSLDGVAGLTLSPDEEALIGREWRALQTAWRAAERRYASVLEELQQGRQVPDMNGCYEIQNLRMLVKSLNAYVTVCGGESGPAGSTPGAHTQPWIQLWEDRVWEVATELAEDMYETRVTKKARTAPTATHTQPAATNPQPPMPSPSKTSPQPLAERQGLSALVHSVPQPAAASSALHDVSSSYLSTDPSSSSEPASEPVTSSGFFVADTSTSLVASSDQGESDWESEPMCKSSSEPEYQFSSDQSLSEPGTRESDSDPDSDTDSQSESLGSQDRDEEHKPVVASKGQAARRAPAKGGSGNPATKAGRDTSVRGVRGRCTVWR